MANSELRRTMGRASRPPSKRFDWGEITRRWEDILGGLVGHGKDEAHQ